MNVSHNLVTFTFPRGKFLISKLVCCLPNFALEKLSHDHQPGIVHSSESCQKLQTDSDQREGFAQGLKGDDLSASKGKSLSVATAGTPIWKAKSSPAILPLLQVTLLYSL